MSERAYERLHAASVYLESVQPLVKNLKSFTGRNFELSGIYRVRLTIGANTYGVNFHVAPSVNVDIVISYPQMKEHSWNVDCAHHALVINGRNFGFLTQETFERLTKSHGIHSFRPVSLCAKMSITIAPIAEAFVPIEVKGNADADLVMFEPDPAYISTYHTYPCPGLVDIDQPTKLRLLNANPNLLYTICMGTVLG